MKPWGQRSEQTRIARFWQWWADHRHDVLWAAESGEREYPRLAALLDLATAALGDVAWEFAPGDQKRWQLVLSPAGLHSLLPLTVACVEAAPDDEAVEFLPAMPSRPNAIEADLRLDNGQHIDLKRMLCAVRAGHPAQLADLTVFHPVFGSLPRHDQYAITRLALHAVLGEFTVLSRIGAIEPATRPQTGMTPIKDLHAVLRDRLG
jgi:hypothetical protein